MMGTIAPPAARRRVPSWLVPAIGYVISIATLVWAFHRFPVGELVEHVRTMHWGWLALGVGIELGSFFVDGWRWRALLRPAGPVTFGAAVQAVFASMFVNDLIPARAGEAVRCFLLSWKNELRLSLVITSLVVLRVMDGIWVVVFFFATSFVVEGAGAATSVMIVYASVVAVLAAVLLFALFHRQHAHHFVSNRSWAARSAHFLDEIHKLGHWRELGIVMLTSGGYWALQIFAVWAITRADNFYYTFGQMSFLLILKSVGTLVPTAPAGVGAFQATAIYALRHFFTEAPDAKILAEILFGFITLPGLAGGAIAVALAGYNLKDLVNHAQEMHRKHKAELES
ncbi:MAG TPA: lysylphosphatidylglycerol synthase transmembrane domain-containing protein [Bryobacteraceae bacterium]|nr:lysylphosphatidylglycerol synthase transmembrane domain-containing protein [Bryobacteraceae bacterium]